MPMKSVRFCFTGWRSLNAGRRFQLQSHDAELTGQVLVTLIIVIVFYKNAIACFILFRCLVKRGVSSLATGLQDRFGTNDHKAKVVN